MYIVLYYMYVCVHYNSIMNNTTCTCTCVVIMCLYVLYIALYYVCVHYNSIMNNIVTTCTCVVIIIYVSICIVYCTVLCVCTLQ